MTDWNVVRRQDFAVPSRPVRDLVGELGEMLGSPDPVERDELGYSVLATWLARGAIPEDLRLELGDLMVRRFSADDVWARTFAPLVLDALVTHGTFEGRWVAPFARWYVDETDLRGYDEELGWLHAVAHGADLLGTFGRHPEVRAAIMLDVAARRLTAPTSYVWRDGEDERLGHAISLTLTHPDLATDDALAWIDTVASSWAELAPGPPPAWASNAARTLRVVLGMTLTGTRAGACQATPLRHADAVRDRLLAALHSRTPYMW